MGRLINSVVILVLVGTVYSLPSKTDELQESKRAEIWKRLRTLIERIEVPGKRQYSSYYSSSSSYGSSSYGNSYGGYYGSTSYGNSYGGSYSSSSYGNSYGSYGSYSYGNSYGSSYGSNSYGYSYGGSYGSNGNGSSHGGSYGSNSYGYSYGGSYGSNSYGNSYGGSYGSNSYGNSYGGSYGSNSYDNSYGGSYGSNSYGNSYSGSYGSNSYGNSYGGSYGSYGYEYSYGGSYGSGGYINDGPYSGAGLHNGHDQQFGREAIKYVLGLIGDLLNEAVDNENDPHPGHGETDKCREVQGLLPYDETYMYHDSDGQWRMFEKMGVTLRYLAYTINQCSGTEVLSQYNVDYLIDMASSAYQLESLDPYIGIAELEAAYNAEKDYAVGSYGSMWTPECSKVITAFDCNMEQLHEKMVMSMYVK